MMRVLGQACPKLQPGQSGIGERVLDVAGGVLRQRQVGVVDGGVPSELGAQYLLVQARPCRRSSS